MYRPVPATQPCTLASTTGYRVYWPVPAIQPCTLASATVYRVYRPVLATQPCILASTTGYRVYRLVPTTQPSTLASTTGYRMYRPVPATQPCTLASTNWLQRVPTGTGCTTLYTCFSNWLHMFSPNWLPSLLTGYTVVTVQCFTPTGYTHTKKNKKKPVAV